MAAIHHNVIIESFFFFNIFDNVPWMDSGVFLKVSFICLLILSVYGECLGTGHLKVVMDMIFCHCALYFDWCGNIVIFLGILKLY